MQRFFVTFPLSIDLVLTDVEIVHQLARVLRVQLGQEVILFDGDGSETLYEITEITKKSISLRGKERIFPHTEPERNITLYQWMPNKIEKIEYIIQKGVEVGIARFVFFRSDRSQKLILSESKKIRFIAIAREALEQCGGLVMPEIEFLDTLSVSFWGMPESRGSNGIDPEINSGWQAHGLLRSSQWQEQEQTPNIVLDTIGKSLKMQEMPQNNEISIWVGPEGGWSDVERVKMEENGFIFARFGERVLRTETAWVVMAFALIYA